MIADDRAPRPGLYRLLPCLLCLLLLWTAAACAAPPLVINPEDPGRYPMRDHMDVLIDPDEPMTPYDAVVAASRGAFRPLTATRGANFGFIDSAVWLHFRIKVPRSGDGRLILEIPYAQLDRVTLHLVRPDGTIDSRRTGDRIPFSHREVSYRMPAFRLRAPPGDTLSGFLEVSSEGAVQAPAVLWKEATFDAAARREGYVLGPYYGILGAMALYNLLVFVSLRDRDYLYYVGAISTFGLFALTLNGFGFQFLWPETPSFSAVALPLFSAIGIFALLQFSRSFLRINRNTAAIGRILFALQIISAIMIVGVLLLPYRAAALTITVVVLASSVVIFASALLCWLRGERQARFFVLAWAIFLVGAILFTLNLQGLIPANLITRNGVQIGSAIEMILLAFALADRMLLLQAENDRIQSEAAKRLLRDLHDGMGRHFVRLIREVEDRAVPRTHLQADLRQAFADMRLLVSSTQPNFCNLANGLATTREQFDGILRDHDIAWNWQVSLGAARPDRRPEQVLNALRIVQEALTNSVKYSRATTITVRAWRTDESATIIEIEDDGIGINDVGKHGHGNGLRHMQQRARDHGIELTISNELARIQIRMPGR